MCKMSVFRRPWSRRLFTILFQYSIVIVLIHRTESSNVTAKDRVDDRINFNDHHQHRSTKCVDGLLFAAWKPSAIDELSIITRIYRGTIYFVALIYFFLGVSIISDRFMAAIEVITSQERQLTVRSKKTGVRKIKVRVWNETVANLTLMALGSSAPEILLSIIEIVAKNYVAGDLGPGTIVGSAAYNLFLIIALCVYVVPDGEVRRIKHLRVFFVTSVWSIFAYVWMYVMLAVTSVGVVEVWEALLTFAFFPATVYTAYLADRKLLSLGVRKFRKYRLNKNRTIVASEDKDDDRASYTIGRPIEQTDELEEEIIILEEANGVVNDPRYYAIVLRDLKKTNPHATLDQLEKLATDELNKRTRKSKAYYRLQTSLVGAAGQSSHFLKHHRESSTAEIGGGSNTSNNNNNKTGSGDSINKTVDNSCKIFFQPDYYAVLESVGQFEVTVIRTGDLTQTIVVHYCTADGTALAGSDYIGQKGTLVFKPGEIRKTIVLTVIDDDVFEEDEHFYVHLTRAVPTTVDNSNDDNELKERRNILSQPITATIIILDDDHCGLFGFVQNRIEITESAGIYGVEVVRSSGARGRVQVPYYTIENTAKSGKQFVETRGKLIFENNEPRKQIEIPIVEENCYEKNVSFHVQLESPIEIDEAGNPIVKADKEEELNVEEIVAQDGRPKLGAISTIEIIIKESDDFKNTVNKLVEEGIPATGITSSWSEQFCNAFRISADYDDDEEQGQEPKRKRRRTCCNYFTHSLTFVWKLLFAFVPPPELWSGYLCFITSIIVIGLLTAVIGDLASHFGCTVGLKDSVTAVTFVALGTSVPDTFASKVAAIQDSTADNSVGNVTGSNAVNVFLGIGITWSIASIYHAAHGNKFRVDPGNLAFCVTLFVSEAALTIIILLLRRSKSIGGELGGPRCVKIITSLILSCFWVFYVFMTTLEAYGIIKGF